METVFLALRVLLSLAVVLGMLWFIHRKLTKGGRMPRAAKAVNVVTRQNISAKASVVVMEADGKRFLLGVTEQSITVLNTSDVIVESLAEPAPQRLTAVTETTEDAVGARRVGGSAAFARVLSDLHGEPAPVAYLASEKASGLDGSILSPATWKRTAAALRRAR